MAKHLSFNPNTFAGLVGKVRKKLSPEGGRKGGWRKKRAQRARRTRASDFVRFYSVRVIMYIKMVGIFVKFWHTCLARVTVYQMSIQ